MTVQTRHEPDKATKEMRDEESRRKTMDPLLKAELHLENLRRILDDLRRELGI